MGRAEPIFDKWAEPSPGRAWNLLNEPGRHLKYSKRAELASFIWKVKNDEKVIWNDHLLNFLLLAVASICHITVLWFGTFYSRYSSPPFLKVDPLHLWRWLGDEKIICHSRENLKSVLVILPLIQFNQNLKLVYYPSRAGPKNVKRAGPRSSFILNEPPKSSARPGSAHLSSSFSQLTPRPTEIDDNYFCF